VRKKMRDIEERECVMMRSGHTSHPVVIVHGPLRFDADYCHRRLPPRDIDYCHAVAIIDDTTILP